MIEQHKSISEKLLKKGFWLYIFSFIIAPMGYIIKIILSGELEVDEMGIIYGVLSLMVLLSSFNDFGMTESMNKFIPQYITEKRYDKVKTIMFYAFITQMITGIIIFLFLYFGSNYISLNYFNDSRSGDIIKLFSLYFLGINVFQVINTFFISIQNTFLQKLTEFLRMIFILCFTLYIFVFDLGNMFNYSMSWVAGLYVGIIISVTFFYYKYYKKDFKNVKIIFDKALFLSIVKYAFLVFLGAQAGNILSQIDMQMIIYLLGNTSAGYYTNYLSIIGIPFMIIGPIFALLFPVFSEMFSKGEIRKIQLTKKIFSKNFLVIGLALNIFLFVFAIIIAKVLFGEKFLPSGEILQYSILFLVFNFLIQINFNIFAAIGQVKERLNITLITILINGILNYILIIKMGVVGAALATGISWVVMWLLTEYKLKDYRVGFDVKFILKNTIFLSILGILMYIYILPIFDNLTRINGFFMLVFLSIIYFSLFVVFNYKDFKYFINEAKTHLKFKK